MHYSHVSGIIRDMWFKQHSLMLRTAVAAVVGFTVMCLAQGWVLVPSLHKSCVDSIIMVHQVKFGACDPGQSLSYMRDLDGARYIICRCHGSGDLNEAPETPGLILKEFDPDINADPQFVPDVPPHIQEQDPTEQTL